MSVSTTVFVHTFELVCFFRKLWTMVTLTDGCLAYKCVSIPINYYINSYIIVSNIYENVVRLHHLTWYSVTEYWGRCIKIEPWLHVTYYPPKCKGAFFKLNRFIYKMITIHKTTLSHRQTKTFPHKHLITE